MEGKPRCSYPDYTQSQEKMQSGGQALVQWRGTKAVAMTRKMKPEE